MKAVLRVALAAGIAMLSTAAAPAWLTTVSKTADGYRLGNPDAKVKLVAFESYTCPHCAHFEQEDTPKLKLVYIQNGQVSLEVRHFVRDPVDLTAAMLTQCVPQAKFFDVHRSIFLSYDKFAPVMSKATKAQRDRWYSPNDRAAGRRTIASDMGFYPIVAKYGLNRAAADKCLGNQAAAERIAAQTAAIDKKYPDLGTPSFIINGVMLGATHEWSMLKLQIDARL